MTTQDWNTVSLFCTGKRIDNPCDGENNISGNYTADCLSYLWQNKGAGGSLGPTYTNLIGTASLSGNANVYCTTKGTMAPIGDNGQINTAAVSTANSKGDITAIKTFYNSIHKTANNNALQDNARQTAIQQCYGISLSTLPSNEIPGSIPSATTWDSVLDSSTGRTKSLLSAINYNPFNWENVSRSVVEIGGISWGSPSSIGLPPDTKAKWIWKDNAAPKIPSRNWNWNEINNATSYSLYKRYNNNTKNTIQATIYATANDAAYVYVNDKLITAFGGRYPYNAKPGTFTISLPPGDNKIEFKVYTFGGIAGILVVAMNGTDTLFVSDNSWTW
jgi:hypothetical protein